MHLCLITNVYMVRDSTLERGMYLSPTLFMPQDTMYSHACMPPFQVESGFEKNAYIIDYQVLFPAEVEICCTS